MNDKELELIKQAMQLEDDGAEYYLAQSKQWHSKQVCDNFRQLSEEEKEHEKWLRELFDAKKSFGDQKIFSYIHVEKPKIYDWSDIQKHVDLGLKDVFKKAMDMEALAIDHYVTIREASEDHDLIHLLDVLIEWEETHYQSFKEVYESL